MNYKHHKAPFITASFMLVFYIISIYFNALGLFSHSLIDIFAGGRSTVKVGLFFGFTILLGLVAVIADRTNPAKLKIKNVWIFSSLAATFLYNIFLLQIFFQKFGFKFKDFVITFHNGEISSTTMLHNHVMKGFNALLLKPFGLASNENVDTGFAFVGLIHPAWLWVGGLLVLICAVLLIIKFIELYSQKRSSEEKWIGLFIVLYSIVSFSLLKNMLDGGILNRETPVALVGLGFILMNRRTTTSKKSILLALSPLLLFILAAALNFELFLSYITLIGVFIVVLGTMLYWGSLQKVTRLGVLLLILSVITISVPLGATYDSYTNSQSMVPKTGAYVGLYHDPNIEPAEQKDWELIEKIHDLAIYRFIPTQPVKLESIAKDNHLLTNLGPIAVPWLNCMPASPMQVTTFTVVSPQQIDSNTTQYETGNLFKIEYIGQSSFHGDSVDGKNILYQYKVGFVATQCAPRILNIVGELLMQRGLKDFFILNISDQNAGV